MATDWSARAAAIEHFEKLVKHLKRVNHDDKELYETALHALRRSQDHTAIQAKLNTALSALRSIKDMTDADNPESYRADDCDGCLDAVFASAKRALSP